MTMNPGSITEAITYAEGQFLRGMGAAVEIDDRLVILIPTRLYDEAINSLLIVVVGQGSMVWAGDRPLTSFQLVSAGVKPLALAEDIAKLVNATFRHLQEQQQIANSRTVPQITDGSKDINE